MVEECVIRLTIIVIVFRVFSSFSHVFGIPLVLFSLLKIGDSGGEKSTKSGEIVNENKGL